VLARGRVVRAALVPTQAGPLAGDEDRVRIVVGAGATLIVEPVAATLALPGAAGIVLSLDVTVEAGGRFVLDEAPLIVAAGAHVTRRCTVTLQGPGAVAVLRETVVLGRDGEPPGTLDSELRATLDGRALLHDGLRVGAASPQADAHVALAPSHRVLGTICLLGARPQGGEPYALAGPGALRRATGPSLAVVDRALEATWRAWSAGALSAAGASAGPAAATRG
jgi:urease accessory protein